MARKKFKGAKSPYRTHYVEPSILQQSPDVNYDLRHPEFYFPNGDEQMYKDVGLNYYNDYKEFREGMLTYYKARLDPNRDPDTTVPVKEIFDYNEKGEKVLKQSMYAKGLDLRMRRFWYEYLRRDALVESGKYAEIKATQFKNNILEAISRTASSLGYITKEDLKVNKKELKLPPELQDIVDFLNKLDAQQMIKLAGAKARENDSKSRAFLMDIFYVPEGMDEQILQSAHDTFFENVKQTIPQLLDPTSEESKETIQRYEKTTKEARRIRESVIRNKQRGINKSLIKVSKSGRMYILFKTRKESDEILAEMRKMDD